MKAAIMNLLLIFFAIWFMTGNITVTEYTCLLVFALNVGNIFILTLIEKARQDK
jgi:hypothetical protein